MTQEPTEFSGAGGTGKPWTSPTSREEWEVGFDERFCRVDLSDDKGRRRDDWFFPETLTPREVKVFISQLLARERSAGREEVINYIRRNLSKKSYTDAKYVADDVELGMAQARTSSDYKVT